MEPIDRLFWPTPRDQQGNSWGPRYFRLTHSDTATTVAVGSNYTGSRGWPVVGLGYLDWIKQLHFSATPGAGQLCTRLTIAVTSGVGVGQLVQLGALETPGAANERRILTLDPKICLLGDRHYLTASAEFDAGVNANQVDFSVSSMVTVKGNVAAF